MWTIGNNKMCMMKNSENVNEPENTEQEAYGFDLQRRKQT